MIELLEEAIARVRLLPDADQDAAAAILLTLASKKTVPLDDATRAAIREGKAQARRGEFADDGEIARLFSRHSE
jgi:predicted transcriptional regulator